jgi:L-fuculose-phosphate aldolase
VSAENVIAKAMADVALYSRLGFNRLLVRAAGGNLSVRLPNEQGFVVTPTGLSLRLIEQQGLPLIDAAGQVIGGARHLKPSQEIKMHLYLYARYAHVNAVVHLHPAYATAYARHGGALPLLTSQARTKLGQIPVADYAPPGTQALVDNIHNVCESTTGDLHAILLEDHGVVTFGESLEEAFNTADLVEESAQIAFVRKVFT